MNITIVNVVADDMLVLDHQIVDVVSTQMVALIRTADRCRIQFDQT